MLPGRQLDLGQGFELHGYKPPASPTQARPKAGRAALAAPLLRRLLAELAVSAAQPRGT